MSEHRNNIEETEEGLDMAEIILAFKKAILFLKANLKVLLVLGFIGALCGFYYAKSQKIEYSAVTTFALEVRELKIARAYFPLFSERKI